MPLYPPSDPSDYLEVVQISDFDLPGSRKLQYIYQNTPNTNSNSPNNAHAWAGIYVPWPDPNFDPGFGWQMAARYNNNPEGLWWRQTSNQVGSPWYRLVDEKIINWTPVLASDNNISWQYINRNAYYIKHASLVFIYCNLIAQPTSGQPMPTGSVRISGFPITPTGVFTNTCRASGGGAVKYAHRVNLFTNSLITFTKNFVSGADVAEANYSWSDTNTGYFTTEFNLIIRV
jgi:hypothetical protein